MAYFIKTIVEGEEVRQESNFFFDDYQFSISTGDGSARISQPSSREGDRRESSTPFYIVIHQTLTAPTKASIATAQVQFGEIKVLYLDKRAIKILCLWNRALSRCCLAVVVGRGRVADRGNAFRLSRDYGEDKLVNQLVSQGLIPQRFLKVLYKNE